MIWHCVIAVVNVGCVANFRPRPSSDVCDFGGLLFLHRLWHVLCGGCKIVCCSAGVDNAIERRCLCDLHGSETKPHRCMTMASVCFDFWSCFSFWSCRSFWSCFSLRRCCLFVKRWLFRCDCRRVCCCCSCLHCCFCQCFAVVFAVVVVFAFVVVVGTVVVVVVFLCC